MAERKSREAKSDTGIVSLAQSVLKDGFGLSTETVVKMMKIVRSQGELAIMKQHVRGLSGGTYKRFNQAIDMAEKDLAKKRASGEEDKDDREKAPEKKEGVKESTFLNYLMTELSNEGGTDVDYTGTDDSKLTSQQVAQKRAQMKDDPSKRRLDKKARLATTPQQEIAAENERHRLRIKEINDKKKGAGA